MSYEAAINALEVHPKRNLQKFRNAARTLVCFNKRKTANKTNRAQKSAEATKLAQQTADAAAAAKAALKAKHRAKWRKSILAVRTTVRMLNDTRPLRVQDFVKTLLPEIGQFCYVQTDHGLELSNRMNARTEFHKWGFEGKAGKKNDLLEEAKECRETAKKYREEAEKLKGDEKQNKLNLALNKEKIAAAKEKCATDEYLDKELKDYVDAQQKTLFPLNVDDKYALFSDVQQKEQYEKEGDHRDGLPQKD